MDRRKSLKLIATGAVAVPAVIAGCTTTDKKVAEPEKAETATPVVARAQATEKPAPADNKAKRERDKKEAEKKAERARTTARRRE